RRERRRVGPVGEDRPCTWSRSATGGVQPADRFGRHDQLPGRCRPHFGPVRSTGAGGNVPTRNGPCAGHTGGTRLCVRDHHGAAALSALRQPASTGADEGTRTPTPFGTGT